jgi:N-acetylneuraminic acid mutarotase
MCTLLRNTGIFCLFLLAACDKSTTPPLVESPPVGTWTPISAFPGGARYLSVAFVLDGKAYVGTGDPGTRSDFWALDPSTEQWTQVASIPVARAISVAFSLNGHGYVLTGRDTSGQPFRDCWRYTPGTDTWTPMANFPGEARYEATAFAINGKGYMGTGRQKDTLGVQKHLRDWWEYDPASDTWTQKADFPDGPCAFAAGIGVGEKGFLGLAGPGPEPGHRWWEYDPTTDTWTKKADYPGTSRYGAGIFAIDNRIYAGNGTYGMAFNPGSRIFDWWEYNIETDYWKPAASQSQTSFGGTGFAIGNTGYFGLGDNDNGYFKSNFWKFTLD